MRIWIPNENQDCQFRWVEHGGSLRVEAGNSSNRADEMEHLESTLDCEQVAALNVPLKQAEFWC